MKYVEIEKVGSATTRLDLPRQIGVLDENPKPSVGDVIAVRAMSESLTYGDLELPSGRLAKIKTGDVLLGVLGRRRVLKGFVGDVPETVSAGDRMHLLNMGGVIGKCTGHHSSLSDAIEVEVIGIACYEGGNPINIADGALAPAGSLLPGAPIIAVAGSCMNSGKTVAATEVIKQASNAGYRVAAAKMTGIACLRDTLQMQDNGAIVTASFIDCGLPSTVDCSDLASVAKAIINHLNTFDPDLIVIELGDGIVGGYGVDSILEDRELIEACTSFMFCAADYVSVIGGITVLGRSGVAVDVIAGSVTDSQMGEDFIQDRLGLPAGNARRDGKRLFELVAHGLRIPALHVTPGFSATPALIGVS